MPRVVISGGGVSGLSTGAFLDEVDTVVLESTERAGGNVRTDIVDGRVLDRAANGWLNTEPAMHRLLARLGLTDQITPASERSATRWIYANGEMQIHSKGQIVAQKPLPWLWE